MFLRSLSQRRDFLEKANFLGPYFSESLSKVDDSPNTNTMRSSFPTLRLFTVRGDFGNII